MDRVETLLLQLYRLARVTPAQEFPAFAWEITKALAATQPAQTTPLPTGLALPQELDDLLESHRAEAVRLNATLRPGPDSAAYALLASRGMLLCHTQAFARLIAGSRPDASLRLPASLLASLLQGQAARIAAGTIEIRPVRLGSVWLLNAAAVPLSRRLTPCEYSVAQRFGAGQPCPKIAEEMKLAPSTVRNTVQRIYQKLDINSKAALAELLLEEG